MTTVVTYIAHSAIPWLAAAFVMVGILAGARRLLGRGRHRAPYDRQPYLLTRAEWSFYRVLSHAVDDHTLICPKVRLADLLNVERGLNDKRRRAAFGRIVGKHVDFVLCDTRHVRPQVVIELDDRSHQRPDRQQRDRFVDAAFANAGLPIVHVPTQKSYSTDALRATLAPYCQSASTLDRAA
ncbi:DUF2726 domain-containing protein [Salinisphaera orenii]|uniref:DUF2726 domain-containing protein n=1 Tax=Salinisphaera orenii TaxID=856731 RepID=UPI000DBE78F7